MKIDKSTNEEYNEVSFEIPRKLKFSRKENSCENGKRVSLSDAELVHESAYCLRSEARPLSYFP